MFLAYDDLWARGLFLAYDDLRARGLFLSLFHST
jgi:hypothetical protein